MGEDGNIRDAPAVPVRVQDDGSGKVLVDGNHIADTNLAPAVMDCRDLVWRQIAYSRRVLHLRKPECGSQPYHDDDHQLFHGYWRHLSDGVARGGLAGRVESDDASLFMGRTTNRERTRDITALTAALRHWRARIGYKSGSPVEMRRIWSRSGCRSRMDAFSAGRTTLPSERDYRYSHLGRAHHESRRTPQ
jgi:hypothetical protein